MYTHDEERQQVHPSWHLPPYHVPPSTDAADILNTPPTSPYATYETPHFGTPPPSPSPTRLHAARYDTVNTPTKVAAPPPAPPYEQHQQLEEGDISASPYGPPAPTARAKVVAFDADGKQKVAKPQRPVQQLSHVQEAPECTSEQSTPQTTDVPAPRGNSLERTLTPLESQDSTIGPRVTRLHSAASDRTQIYFPPGESGTSDGNIITRAVASFIDKSSSRPSLAPTVPLLRDASQRASAAKGKEGAVEGPERPSFDYDEDDILNLLSSLMVRAASFFQMWCYSVRCVVEDISKDVSKDMLELCKTNHAVADRTGDLYAPVFQPQDFMTQAQEDVSTVRYEAIPDHAASHATVHPFGETDRPGSWGNATVKRERHNPQSCKGRSTPPLTQSFEHDVRGTPRNADNIEFTPYGPAPWHRGSGCAHDTHAQAGGPPHMDPTRDVQLAHSTENVGLLKTEPLGTDSDEGWCTAREAREDGTCVKRKKGSKVNWRVKTASFNSTDSIEGDLMLPRGRGENLWQCMTDRNSYVAKLPQNASEWDPSLPPTTEVANYALSSDPPMCDNINHQTTTFQYRRPHMEWKNKHMSSNSEGSTTACIPTHNAVSSVESYRPYGEDIQPHNAVSSVESYGPYREGTHNPAHYMDRQGAGHPYDGDADDRHTEDWSSAGRREYQQFVE